MLYFISGTSGHKRVSHIRHFAGSIRFVRVQKGAGNQKQDIGGDSNVVQTGIVQINHQVCPVLRIIRHRRQRFLNKKLYNIINAESTTS